MYIYLIGRSRGWSFIPPKYQCGCNQEKKQHLHKLQILIQNNLENPQPKIIDPVAFSGCEIKRKIYEVRKFILKNIQCIIYNASNSSVSIFVLFALLNIIMA